MPRQVNTDIFFGSLNPGEVAQPVEYLQAPQGQAIYEVNTERGASLLEFS
jgi:hypothetical protein